MNTLRLLILVLFSCLTLVSSAHDGERVAAYPVGNMAAGYVVRSAGLDPLRVQGPVQARNTSTQQLKIQGYWIPVAHVWRPIDPQEITLGPTDATPEMGYGTPLWGVLLQAPKNGGGYAGEAINGAYGGHRWTSIGRLVICVWVDSTRTDRVPDCNASGEAYRRIHVENVALR